MFFHVLLTSALVASAHGQACEEVAPSASEQSGSPADVSFLQHALKLGDLRTTSKPNIDTYTLFVKFHKVAGSTWRDYVDIMQGEDQNCSGKCGDYGWMCRQMMTDPKKLEYCLLKNPWAQECNSKAHSCTFHQSIGVIRQAIKDKELTPANSSDLAGVANLWPDKKRFQLLWAVEWTREWLPANFHNKRILITTLLREPTERIRSYYYFKNSDPTHEGFVRFLEFRRDFVAGNVTDERYEEERTHDDRGFTTTSILLRSCCEYETWLGDGSVERSKLTLSTQFDLVGITERMNDALVALGRLYGLSVEETARIGRTVPHELDNSDNKKDWTDQELQLATYVAQKSTQVYNFGQELFQRQSLSLFGDEASMRGAVETFEKLDPASAD